MTPSPKSSSSLAGPLLSASLIISITSLLSRFLGLYRDRLLAGTFGADNTLDMYYASFRIPDLIFNLLILGALSSAFIPIFKELISKKQNTSAWYITNNLINVLLIFVLSICAIVFIFATPLTRLITPGFDSDQIQTTAALTRIMLVSPIFFTLSSIVGGMLNSFKRFVSYSLAPIMYNLGIIFGIIFLVPIFGIYGLAYGVILGACLNLLIQIPETYFTGYRYQPVLNFQDKYLSKIISLTVPTMFSLAVTQVNLTIDTVIASTLTSGSISVINLASNLFYLPIGVFAIPICTAVFPNLVEHISNKNYQLFSEQLSRSTKQILFVIIPSAIFLFIFRAQIVRILLGTGSFDWNDTTETLKTLGFFAFSLPFQALIPLFYRSFYSTQNTTKPLISSFISMIINVIFSLLLAPRLGVSGLALSFAIASTSNLIICNYLLHQHLPKFHFRIGLSILKITIAAIIAGIIGYFSLSLFEPVFDNTTFIGLFFQTSTSSILGVSSYLLASYFLKIEELFTIGKIFKISFIANIFNKK